MTSILELVEALVRDPHAKADYSADPGAFLDRHGLGNLEEDDISEALGQAADSFPPALAARVDPSAGFGSLTEVDLDDLGLEDVDDFSGGARLDDGTPTSFAPDSELDLERNGAFDATLDGGRNGEGDGATADGHDQGDGRLGADVELDRAEPADRPPATDDGDDDDNDAARLTDARVELTSLDDEGTAGDGFDEPRPAATTTATDEYDTSRSLAEEPTERGDLLDDVDQMDAVRDLRGADGFDGPSGFQSDDGLGDLDDLDGLAGAGGAHDGDSPWLAGPTDDHDDLARFDESATTDLDDL